MNNKQFYFTLKGSLDRLKKEYYYYTKRPWSLQEVGEFWDSVEDYDDINNSLYPYFKRFTNSYEISKDIITEDDYNMLDIQTRSGNGALFWYNKNKLRNITCVDFSDYLLSLAQDRLKNINIDCDYIKVLKLPLPFKDEQFNFICTYETIEHVYDYKLFFSELVRVAKKDCIIILTCPNILWEWVHWLSAVININHSEGPHRFLRRKSLIKIFKKNNVQILKENSTIILPFNNKVSIKLDKLIFKYSPSFIMRLLALRRTFILKKS